MRIGTLSEAWEVCRQIDAAANAAGDIARDRAWLLSQPTLPTLGRACNRWLDPIGRVRCLLLHGHGGECEP